MKKLYLLILATLVPLLSSAATVYFQNTANWSTVYAYMWGGTGDDTSWPGKNITTQAITATNGTKYWYVETTNANIIFDNNSSQTEDLTVKDGAVYSFSANGKNTGNTSPIGYITKNGNDYVFKEADGPDYSTYTVALLGDFNGWSNSMNKAIPDEDGIATFTAVSIGTSQFKITVNGSWYGSNSAIKQDNWQSMSTSGGNTSVSGASTGDVFDVKYDCANNQILITKSEEEPDYSGKSVAIAGGFNDWSPTANVATTAADGIATFTNLTIGTSEFKIVIDGAWYGASSSPIAQGSWSTFTTNGGNTTISGASSGDIFTVKFNIIDNQISVEKTGQQAALPFEEWDIIILGEFNEWNTTEPVYHPDSEGNCTITDLEIGNGQFKVLIKDGLASAYYSTGNSIAHDTFISLNGNAEANMTISGATEDDIFNFVFDLDNMQFKVVCVNTPEISDIAQSSTNEVSFTINPFFTLYYKATIYDPNAQVTTLSVDELVSDGYKIATGGNNGVYTFNRNSLLSEFNLSQTSDQILILSTYPVNAAGNQGEESIVGFTVDGKLSGIAGIEAEAGAVRYYNLQGVEVVNPESGLYIEVRGTSARKVAIQ